MKRLLRVLFSLYLVMFLVERAYKQGYEDGQTYANMMMLRDKLYAAAFS